MAAALGLALGGCLAVGTAVGLTGIGGFLLPPWLIATLPVEPREAVAFTLLAFAPSSGIAGLVYARTGAIDWWLAGLLALGSLPGIAAGFLAGSLLGPRLLRQIIGLALIVVAVWLLRRTGSVTLRDGSPAGLLAVGTVAGVAAVLVGITGPLLLVPALSGLGVEVRRAVGTSLAASVIISLVGAAGLLRGPGLRWDLFVPVGLAILGGTALGALLARRIAAAALVAAIRILCALAGAWMLVR